MGRRRRSSQHRRQQVAVPSRARAHADKNYAKKEGRHCDRLTVACQLPGLSLAVMGRGAPSGRSVRTSAGDYAGKSFKWQETSAFPAPFHFCPKGSLTTVLQITSSNSPALNRSGRPLVRWLRASATSLPPANCPQLIARRD